MQTEGEISLEISLVVEEAEEEVGVVQDVEVVAAAPVCELVLHTALGIHERHAQGRGTVATWDALHESR